MRTPWDSSDEQVAADWIARCDAGLTPGERRALQEWLAGDPRRAEAFRRLEQSWAAMNAPRRRGRGEALLRAAEVAACRRQRRRRRTWIGWSSALTAAAMLVVWLRFSGPEVATPDPVSPSVALSPDRQTLPDGSAMELAAGARVEVLYSAERRRIRLLSGEAFFVVEKDPSRPFVVEAGDVGVRAVGTQFSVRFAPEKVDVLVTEGRVAVASANESPAAAVPVAAETLVSAGNLAEVGTRTAARLRAVTEDEIRRALAWRHRRIEFSATPLGEAVAWINRVNTRQIVLGPEADTLQITGAFWTDDPEGFARLVESSLDLVGTYEPATIRLELRAR